MHKRRAEYENAILTGDDMTELRGVALPAGIPQIDPDTGQPVTDEAGRPVILDAFPKTHDSRFRFDPHDIHLEAHHKLLFSREFASLPEKNQEYIIGHIDMHEQALAEMLNLMRAQQMEEVATGEVGGP